MGVHAERGMSAPPEVVFNTATDPDRFTAWLPAPLRRSGGGPELDGPDLRATWGGDRRTGWTARLQVRPLGAGGATVRLELATGRGGDADTDADQRLSRIVDEALACLADEVAENLTPG